MKTKKVTITRIFSPNAGENEFWKWVREEIRKNYPKGKIIAEFKISQLPTKNSNECKKIVTANVTIEES